MNDERPGSPQPDHSQNRVVLPSPREGTWPQSAFPTTLPDPTPRQGTAPQVPFPSMSADVASQQSVPPQDDFFATVADPPQPPPASVNVFQNPKDRPVKSGLLIHASRPQGSFFSRLGHLLRTDPAYQVLAIAVAGVLIACLIFVAVAGSMFAPSAPPKQTNMNDQKTLPTATTSADLTPTVVPTATAAATATATATPVPTATPRPSRTPTQPPTLPALQITKIPAQVTNGSRVAVTVQSNRPGTAVWLYVTFSSSIAGSNTTGPATTNASGVAIVNWHVSAIMIGNSDITATVYAVTSGPNGQQMKSAPVTVTVQPK